MRKLASCVGVALLLAACADSTSDVDSTAREEGGARPDTVVVHDDVTVEIYGPLNSYARDRSDALSETAGVRRGFDRLAERGLMREALGAIHVRATDADGRTLEATWFPFVDASDAPVPAAVVHVRFNGQEVVVPLANRDWGEGRPEMLTIDGKEAIEARRTFGSAFGGCLTFASQMFMACMSICGQNGIPGRACSVSCRAAAAAALASCILMSAAE